jgi:hypothetical protein
MIDFGNGNTISTKEFIELRLKCLEIYVSISSKHGIEKKETLAYAESGWNDFVVRTLVEIKEETPQKQEPQLLKTESKVSKAKK